MSNNDLHDERISRLYKIGDGTEPPAHIDAEIKQAARDAAQNRKRNLVWPSLATAAVLVLSLSLMLKVMDQQPLEEPVLQSMHADDQAITPEVLLQEMDKEEPVLKRYKTKRRSMAPAPAKSEMEDREQFEITPAAAISEKISSKAKQLSCSGISIPDTAPKKEWIKRYTKALELGQNETAKCLKQAFQVKFNQAIPEAPK